ncbi:MAG: hypothetical protein WDN75_03555 [Bacteroidota bacterium]
MNERMRSFLFNALIFVMAFSCSKKNDPTVVTSSNDPGCTFTFKGNGYSSSTVTCVPSGHLSASGGTGNFAWVLAMEPGNGYVSLQVSDGTYDTDNATITLKNNTATFDVTLETLNHDKGAFVGKCGCTTGDL